MTCSKLYYTVIVWRMIVVAYLYIATYSVILVVNLITLKQGSEHLLNVVPRRSYYIKEE